MQAYSCSRLRLRERAAADSDPSWSRMASRTSATSNGASRGVGVGAPPRSLRSSIMGEAKRGSEVGTGEPFVWDGQGEPARWGGSAEGRTRRYLSSTDHG